MEEQAIYETQTQLSPMQELVLGIVREHTQDAASKAEIISKLMAAGLPATERDVHRVVADLRDTGYPIIGLRSGGYKWPASPEEALAYIQREIAPWVARLHKREAAIKRNLPVFFGQMGA